MKDKFCIVEISNAAQKAAFTRGILEVLPEWFGNRQALEEYVEKVATLPYWSAFDGEGCIGFFAVTTHYGHTGEIVVCGVLPAYQHGGVGKALYQAAEGYLVQCGCKYAVVKTLSDRVNFEPYAHTRRFYRRLGFEPLITLTEMWDAENPCLIMLKNLD